MDNGQRDKPPNFSSAPDDALRALVRLLARQAARDWLAHQCDTEFAPRQRTEPHQ